MVPPAKHVHMQVIYRLPAVRAGIDHHAITLGETFRAGNVSSRRKKVPEQSRVRVIAVGERRNMLPRYYQKMRGRLRIDVSKRNALLVLVDELRGDASSHDLAEKAIHSSISLQEGICSKDNFAES
jgi:hypothetical protein